jgi:hypothetical protein
MSSTSSRTMLIVVILLSAVLLALGNILCHALVVQELTGTAPAAEPGTVQQLIHSVGAILAQRSQYVWFLTGAPLLMGIILALLVAVQGRSVAAPAPAPATSAAADAATEGALRLLGLLQQEGRLVDFLEEDIQPYSDTQKRAR